MKLADQSPPFALQLLVCLLVLCSLIPGAAADLGNVLAGILGFALGFVCICAGLGWWARRSR